MLGTHQALGGIERQVHCLIYVISILSCLEILRSLLFAGGSPLWLVGRWVALMETTLCSGLYID